MLATRRYRTRSTTRGLLRRLPVEILRNIIFTTYHPNEYWNLATLARVCKEFYNIIIPHIYSHFTMMGWEALKDNEVYARVNPDHPAWKIMRDEKIQTVAFVKRKYKPLRHTLLKNPTLAGHVRHWEEEAAPKDPEDPMMHPVDPTVFTVEDCVNSLFFANLKNLRKVVFPTYTLAAKVLVTNMLDYSSLTEVKVRIAVVSDLNEWATDMRLPNVEVLDLQLKFHVMKWWSEEEDWERMGEGKVGGDLFPDCSQLDGKRPEARRQMSVEGIINLFLISCPRLRKLHLKGDYEIVRWNKKRRNKVLKIIQLLLSRRDVPESEPVSSPYLEHLGLVDLENFIFCEASNLRRPTRRNSREVRIQQVREFIRKLVENSPKFRGLTWDVFNFPGMGFITDRDRKKLFEEPQIFEAAAMMPPVPADGLRSLSLVELPMLASAAGQGQKNLIRYLTTCHPRLESLELSEDGHLLEEVVNLEGLLRLDCLRSLKLEIHGDSSSEWIMDYQTEYWQRVGLSGDLDLEEASKFLWQFLSKLPRSLETLELVLEMTDESLPELATWNGIPQQNGFEKFFDEWPEEMFAGFQSMRSFDLELWTGDDVSDYDSVIDWDRDRDDKEGRSLVYPRNQLVCRRLESPYEGMKNLSSWWLRRCPGGYDHRYIHKRKLCPLKTGEGTAFRGLDAKDWWYPQREGEIIHFICKGCSYQEEAQRYLRP